MKESDFEIELKSIEIRSEEMQEIIGHSPTWIVRFGITLIFIVFIVIITISWFIQYPDTIRANVTITTSPPPLSLVTRTSGNLVLLKKENDIVKKGDYVAFINSTTNFQHVQEVEENLRTQQFRVSHNLELGDLQPYYAALLGANENNQFFLKTNIFDKQIAQIKKQISSNFKLRRALQSQYQLMKEELAIAHVRFQRDSILYAGKVIALLNYEDAQSIYLQQKRNFTNSQTSLTNNEIQINQLEKQAMDLEFQKSEQAYKLKTEVDYIHRELLARIAKWKETYLLTALMNGRVAFLGFWEDGMYAEGGMQIFSIVPNIETIFAQAELPLAGSGKVKVGQEVNIRLENFPYHQYGMLSGKVTEISAMPSDNKYFVKIELSNPLITTYKKALPFKQQLKGETEIITEDLRLLERVFYQFKSLIK
jgi:multidrug efflux pump subunit AcrA (membrane-fusion protein)